MSAYSSIKSTGSPIPPGVNYGQSSHRNVAPKPVTIPSLYSSSPLPASASKAAGFPPYRPPIAYKPFGSASVSSSTPQDPLEATSSAKEDPSSLYTSGGPSYSSRPGWQNANAWAVANFATQLPDSSSPATGGIDKSALASSNSNANPLSVGGETHTSYHSEPLLTDETFD